MTHASLPAGLIVSTGTGKEETLPVPTLIGTLRSAP